MSTPTIVPTASPARNADQAGAPPRLCLAISTPATANISPLAMSAHPPPNSTTVPPLSTAPATLEVLAPSPSRALPVCSRSVGTTSGMIPVSAGNSTAIDVPLTAAAAAIAGSGVQPVSSIAPREKKASAFSDSPAIITRWRGNRSAMTPPTSMNTTIGSDSAVSTTDSVVASAPGRPRTPNARATGANALPSTEIVRAVSSRLNRRSRSSPRSRT